MQQTDGPYRNTRSSAGSLNKSSEKANDIGETFMENEVFQQFNNTKDSELVQKQLNERPRTPSGHILTRSVGDIRNFFASQQHINAGSPVLHQRINRTTNLPSDNNECVTLTSDRSRLQFKEGATVATVTALNAVDITTNQAEQLKRSCVDKQTPSTNQLTPRHKVLETQHGDYLSESCTYDQCIHGSKVTDFMDNQLLFDNNTKPGGIMEPPEDQRYESEVGTTKGAQGLEPPDSLEVPDDPKVMDLQLVIRMFKEIKTDLNQFKKDINLEEVKQAARQKDENTTQIAHLKKDLQVQREKNNVMVGTIQRMSKIMGELHNRVTELEKTNMKTLLVITGFENIPNKQECNGYLTDFLKQTLLIDAKISDSYFIGEGASKAIVMCFPSVQERNKVLFNKSKLKEFVNQHDEPIFINELLPAELNDQCRRDSEIFTSNKRNTASKVEMSFFKGSLQIQNEPYTRKVRVPLPEDFLSLSEDELANTMKYKIQPGKQISERASTFTGFIAKANSHRQVRTAYTKMKLAFPQARHIICAFRVEDVLQCYAEDFCNDGENGAGRVLLELLREQGYKNCALFVVRQYGGVRLGQKRFDIIKQAGEYALQKAVNIDRTEKKTVVRKPAQNKDLSTLNALTSQQMAIPNQQLPPLPAEESLSTTEKLMELPRNMLPLQQRESSTPTRKKNIST